MEQITCSNCGTKNPETNKFCTSCGFELPKLERQIIPDETFQMEILQSKKANKRKNKIGIIVGIVFAFLIAGAAYYFVNKFPFFDKVITQATVEINKSCPMKIDNDTRLDNVEALPGKTLQYNYTLVNYEKSQLNVDTLKKYLEPSILENVKTNPEIKIYRDHKTTMIYNYRDKVGEVLWIFKVTPEMYQ